MNEERIRKIANKSSSYAERKVAYYKGIKDGLDYPAKMLKIRDLKFAELIVKECLKVLVITPVWYTEIGAMRQLRDDIEKHFEVKK